MSAATRYVYLGDAWTRRDLIGKGCDPLRRADGRCVVSVRMATALVRFGAGEVHVVKRRRLRLREKLEAARG